VETTHQRTDYIVYEGWKIRGKPEKVYLRGVKLVDGERWFGKNGAGQFIPRKPHAPVL
jgi:dihydropyrimidinase